MGRGHKSWQKQNVDENIDLDGNVHAVTNQITILASMEATLRRDKRFKINVVSLLHRPLVVSPSGKHHYS